MMNDVEEIKKLKARYFRALDSKDWSAFRSVFAEDATFDLSRAEAGTFATSAAFVDHVSTLAMVQSVHHGHMPEIELTGPYSATGIWSMEDYNLWEDGSQNHGWGHYLETYEKKDGRWYIKTLALSYLRMERVCGDASYIAGDAGVRHLRGTNPVSLF